MKSQTSDPFVSHFDGHFEYLKTLDFSFNSLSKDRNHLCIWPCLFGCPFVNSSSGGALSDTKIKVPSAEISDLPKGFCIKKLKRVRVFLHASPAARFVPL